GGRSGCPPGGNVVLEEDQGMGVLGGGERDHLDPRRPPAPVRTHAKARAPRRAFRAANLLERRPEPVEQALARHLEDVHARVAGRGLEERPRLPAELDDVEVLVDDDTGRGEALLDEAVRLSLDALRLLAA